MIETISDKRIDLRKAKKIGETFGHLVHGDPMGSDFNLVQLGEQGMGYASSKALNNPDLCDFICFSAMPWLVVPMGTMVACFPAEPVM